MGLALIESIGTIVSLVAVVLSVASLTFRTRQNTRSLQTLTYSRSLDRLASFQARLSADADMNRLFSRGLRAPDALSIEDRVRMTWALYEMFGAFEFMFEQARQRALPTDVWDRWAATMAWWVSYPGVQTWWEVKPTPFNPRFSSFVDDLIARSGPATPSAMRWQEFVAQAGGSLFDEPGAVS